MAVRLDRDDRIRVYVAGGFAGGLMGKPVDITLDKIPDDAFERTQQIIRLLTASEKELTAEEITERSRKEDMVGDFGHHVLIGNHSDTPDKLHRIFNGRYFHPTPRIVAELEQLLKEHAKPEDLVLKR